MTDLFKDGDIIKINKDCPFLNEVTKKEIRETGELKVLYCNVNTLIVQGEQRGYVFTMHEANDSKDFSNYFTLIRQAERESSYSDEQYTDCTACRHFDCLKRIDHVGDTIEKPWCRKMEAVISPDDPCDKFEAINMKGGEA